MSVRSKAAKLIEILDCFVHQPKAGAKLLGQLPAIHRMEREQKIELLNLFSIMRRGIDHSREWSHPASGQSSPSSRMASETADAANPLRSFFDSHEKGRGIWKWTHYFDIYHRHFNKFVGRDVNVLEIGIYSGGSLEMWRNYFGPKCHIYGVDIESACKCYENDYTSIFIGDQADRRFWGEFKSRVPHVDIVIDDGGHRPEQQIVTLEEMLPHLRPGGVYLCEDIAHEYNEFAVFVQGLVSGLNAFNGTGSETGVETTGFQAWIRSIHAYPFVTVIEKGDVAVERLIAPKHGTEWQPFLSTH